jgi:hypothetical protein
VSFDEEKKSHAGVYLRAAKAPAVLDGTAYNSHAKKLI